MTMYRYHLPPLLPEHGPDGKITHRWSVWLIDEDTELDHLIEVSLPRFKEALREEMMADGSLSKQEQMVTDEDSDE